MGAEEAIKRLLSMSQDDWTALEDSARAASAGDLSDLIGTGNADSRVRPVSAGGGTKRPFIAYEITNEEDPSPTSNGPSGWTRTDFDLVIVGDTYRDVMETSRLTRAILDGYAGTVGGIRIAPLRYTDQSDVEQQPPPGSEKPAYLRQQSFRMLQTAAG